MKTIKVEYCGMEGQGATVREAKQDAQRKAEQFIKDSENGPYVLQTDGHAIIVYRHFHAWAYRIIGPKFGNCESLCHYNKEHVIRRAKYHLAQALSSVGDVRTDVCDAKDQGELIDYFKWQQRYQDFKAKGFNDSECHRLACGLQR